MSTKSSSKASPTEATAEAAGWYVYMVECADRSLYTGVARDVARRVAEHNEGRAAARYTRARRPVRLAWQEAATDRATACRREAVIKKLSRAEKLRLIEASSQPFPQ
jgi:putative endonuclease